jgi:hypothetical protein
MFKVHESSYILCTGGMILVPRGNTYYIENIADRDAKLFFAQARRVSAEEEAPPEVLPASDREATSAPRLAYKSMKTAMHFFSGSSSCLLSTLFWWKAYVPLPFAHLYSVDDLMICISVSRAPA